uniref:Large ribosomal subunit protein bL9c n=2 Tax=Salix viminalis TaxID=40686 RepID=A0A6N2KAP9_SALVM
MQAASPNPAPAREGVIGGDPPASYQNVQSAATPQPSKDARGSSVEAVKQNGSERREELPTTTMNRIPVTLVTRSTLEVVIPEPAVPKLITKSKNKLAQISEAKPLQNPKLKKFISSFQNRNLGLFVLTGFFVVIMACIQHSRNALRRIIAKETTFKSSDGAMHPLLYACQGVRYRKLEVILTTSIEKLGKAGHTVKVAPGYFRNHLMPKLLAVPNIEKFAHLIREQRKIYQPEEEEEVKVVKETMEDKIKEYETAAKRLAKSRLAFRVGINTAKFRARESKDDPIEILSPVTKDDILKEAIQCAN